MYAGVTARVSYNNCAQAGGKEHGAVNKGTRANIGMSSQDTGVGAGHTRVERVCVQLRFPAVSIAGYVRLNSYRLCG